jgi:hypothetical protein
VKRLVFLFFVFALAGVKTCAAVAEGALASGDVTFEASGLASNDQWAHDAGNPLDELMRSLVRAQSFDGAAYGLKGNYVVVQEVKDPALGRVRLVALRRGNGVYNRALLLELRPQRGASFVVTLPEDVQGIESRFELKNFTTPNRPDVLLTLNNGPGGLESQPGRFLIVQIQDGKGRVVYDSEATKLPTIQGRFLNNYRAELFVAETETRLLIDLSARKEAYLKRLVYVTETNRLRSPITVWRSRAELRPVLAGGLHELRGVLELSGAGRGDLVARVETALRYEEGRWKVVDCWVAPAEDLTNIPLPRRLR